MRTLPAEFRHRQVFSEIKNELRLRELRTIPALECAFGEGLDGITPADALHYFQHAGYSGCSPGRN